ncbi:hypothetical protein IHQ68_17360 [Chelatococcus sambhunathii]|uniref:Membrane-bound metallopeptidase n=1 Tax=Chelatococcus sambhunathii TaxID=363953 RepID=A0ABU1DKI1_9HYPH|nr:hypothetical protein [Chelatococcus sambhunathii]MDR4308390.1 hypothetical protein [Chelatococcus sambhunathii]
MATMLEGPALLSEGENRIINELVRQLREVHPPRGGGLWAKWSPLAFGLVLAVFGAALNSNLNAARDEQKAANARIETIDGRSRDNRIAIERIDRERAARISQVDARLGAIETRTAPMDGLLKDLGRVETAIESMSDRLARGREERIADVSRIVDGMSVQKTELASLRQELQQLRHALEARSGQPTNRDGPGPPGWPPARFEIRAAVTPDFRRF